jgi:hypothetical protein
MADYRFTPLRPGAGFVDDLLAEIFPGAPGPPPRPPQAPLDLAGDDVRNWVDPVAIAMVEEVSRLRGARQLWAALRSRPTVAGRHSYRRGGRTVRVFFVEIEDPAGRADAAARLGVRLLENGDLNEQVTVFVSGDPLTPGERLALDSSSRLWAR